MSFSSRLDFLRFQTARTQTGSRARLSGLRGFAWRCSRTPSSPVVADFMPADNRNCSRSGHDERKEREEVPSAPSGRRPCAQEDYPADKWTLHSRASSLRMALPKSEQALRLGQGGRRGDTSDSHPGGVNLRC